MLYPLHISETSPNPYYALHIMTHHEEQQQGTEQRQTTISIQATLSCCGVMWDSVRANTHGDRLGG